MHALLETADLELLQWVDRQQDRLAQQLIELCEINSGSFNTEGVNLCGQKVATLFADRLGVAITQSQPPPWLTRDRAGNSFSQPLARIWRLQKRPQAPLKLLLCGHLDTVFPPQYPFHCHYLKDTQQLSGPGCLTKGGLLIMLTALELLEQSALAEKIGWTVLLTPDGEIGSPGSIPILEEEAAAQQLGLLFYPSRHGEPLAIQRYGSGNFICSVHSDNPADPNRDAIALLAELIQVLQRLPDSIQALELFFGQIEGGLTLESPASSATLKVMIRIAQASDENRVVEQLQKIEQQFNQRKGQVLQLYGGFNRKPKVLDTTHQTLRQALSGCAQALSFSIDWGTSHETGDGNTLATAGLPNLDCLGAVGRGRNSDKETIDLNSLTERARLSGLWLLNLARHGLPFAAQPQTTRQKAEKPEDPD